VLTISVTYSVSFSLVSGTGWRGLRVGVFIQGHQSFVSDL
jgi:hypothetical protein